MKQAHVAHEAGITSPMLSAYETGKQRPSLATIDKILGALDCDVRHLATALQVAPIGGGGGGESDEPGRIPVHEEASERPVLLRQVRHLIDTESGGAITEAERNILTQTLSGLALLARHVRS